MKRYNSYKDSGVKWIGEIPSHWEERKAKYVFSYKKDVVGEKSNEYELLSLTLQGVIKRDMENPTGKFPASFNTYQEVNNGDFVFCLFDNEETPRTVGLSPYEGMITGAYDVLTKKDNSIDSQFLLYYYLTIDDAKLFKPIYRGLRKTIPFDSFMKYRIPLPPSEEQKAIVLFLNNKTAEIDELVAKVEREIELLKEYKKAEIAHVVTHGINPDTPTKPSGISWIGDIPAHWSLRKLKYIFSETNVKSLEGKETPLSLSKDEGLIPSSEKKNKTMESSSYVGCKIVEKDDIVFNRFRARLFAVSHYDGVVSPDYAVYKCCDEADKQYIVYLLSTDMYREAFNRKASGIGDGFNRLYTEDLFSMYSIFPPIKEQQEIVTYIDRKTTEIDRLVVELTYQVEYLKEYKQRLIADVVTGKINVQNN